MEYLLCSFVTKSIIIDAVANTRLQEIDMLWKIRLNYYNLI